MQRPALERACSSFAPFSDYDALYTAPDEELGRGASGVVRKAYRRSDGLGVAVKTMDLRALRMHGGDAFKIKSYVAAAAAIRALDYAATSGKAMAKPGKTKVAGIGKGIAAKIDEFPETGAIAKLEEYKNEV